MDKQTFYDNVQDYLNSSEKLYGSGKNTATVDPQQLASAVEQAVGSRVDTAARDSLQKAKEYTDQEIKKIPPSTGGGAGTPGPKGDRGERGETGPRGERGEQGPAGQTGPKGADGQTPTVRIASVTTGEPGTQAIVANTGSGTDVALSFTIPRGPKGEPGIQGAAGERGADGAAGAAGKDAVQPTFSVGQVNTLEPGQQAAVRISGTPTAPVLEFDLPRGERGLRGETGAAGGGAGGTAIVPNIEFQTKTVEHTVAASVEKSGSNENPVFTLSVPKGEPGPKGEDGQDGVAGEKGADGVTPVITINARAVEHDQPASVQKSGSDTAPTFTISVPKGEPGVQGEAGERGEAGVTPEINATVSYDSVIENPTVEKSETQNNVNFHFKFPQKQASEPIQNGDLATKQYVDSAVSSGTDSLNISLREHISAEISKVSSGSNQPNAQTFIGLFGTAIYNIYKLAPSTGGGNAAALTSSKVFSSKEQHSLTFSAQSTVSTTLTGLYSVTVTYNYGDQQGGVWLNNGVSKLPEVSAPVFSENAVPFCNHFSFVCKMDAGVSYRLNLAAATEAVNLTKVQFTVTLLGVL